MKLTPRRNRPADRAVFSNTADRVELPDSTREREPRMTPPDSQAVPIVRRATPADLQRIGRLGALLVEEHYGFDSRRFLAARPGTPESYASFIGTQLEDPDAAVLVADDSGDVIGYAYAAVEGYDYMALRGPAGVLHDIIVDPGRRGRGVGRLLLEAALEFFRSRGVPRVVLSTAERNEAAQQLFASAGFRRTMIEMTRDLDDPAS
jgi:ribosomal protein S18 acetylase RimI-like enzyme